MTDSPVATTLCAQRPGGQHGAVNHNPEAQDCYFYFYSTCSKGDSCAFRHCSAALGSEETCSLWRDQTCKRRVCAFRHSQLDRQRSVIQCFWETQATGCLKTHCPFYHCKPRPQTMDYQNQMSRFKVSSVDIDQLQREEEEQRKKEKMAEEQRKKEKMAEEQKKKAEERKEEVDSERCEKSVALDLRRELLKRMLAERIFRERRASSISEEEMSSRDQFPPSLGPGEADKSRPANTKDRLAQSLGESGRLRPPPVPKQVTSSRDHFPPSLGHGETDGSRPDNMKDRLAQSLEESGRLGPPPIQLQVTSSRDQFPPSLGPGEPSRSRPATLEESGRLGPPPIQLRSKQVTSSRDQFPPSLGPGEPSRSRPATLEESGRLGPPPIQLRSIISSRDQFPPSLGPGETGRSRLAKTKDSLAQLLGESGRLRPPPRSEPVKLIPSHLSGPRVIATPTLRIITDTASRGQQSDSQGHRSRSRGHHRSRSRGHHRSKSKDRQETSKQDTSSNHHVTRRRDNDLRPAQQHRLQKKVSSLKAAPPTLPKATPTQSTPSNMDFKVKTLDELRAERLLGQQNSDPPETGEELKKVVLIRRNPQPVYTNTPADSNCKPESRLGVKHGTKRSSGMGMTGTTSAKRQKRQLETYEEGHDPQETKGGGDWSTIGQDFDSGADIDVVGVVSQQVGVSAMEERKKLSITELKTEILQDLEHQFSLGLADDECTLLDEMATYEEEEEGVARLCDSRNDDDLLLQMEEFM